MTRRDCLTVTLAAVWGSFGTRAAEAQPSPASPVAAVMDAERRFAEAMAARDLQAFASHIAAEAVFFSSPDGLQVLRGKTAIVDGWRRFFDGPAAPFSWSPATAEVLESGSLGMTTGPVHNAKGDVTGRFSSVWRLEPDGRWRVIFDRGCNCT